MAGRRYSMPHRKRYGSRSSCRQQMLERDFVKRQNPRIHAIRQKDYHPPTEHIFFPFFFFEKKKHIATLISTTLRMNKQLNYQQSFFSRRKIQVSSFSQKQNKIYYLFHTFMDIVEQWRRQGEADRDPDPCKEIFPSLFLCKIFKILIF